MDTLYLFCSCLKQPVPPTDEMKIKTPYYYSCQSKKTNVKTTSSKSHEWELNENPTWKMKNAIIKWQTKPRQMGFILCIHMQAL